MSTENFIPLDTLCIHYKVNLSFFYNLSDSGLIDIEEIAEMSYIHQDSLHEIEKIIRMHQELDVNIEGIDVVLNLLKKIDALKTELHTVRNRLRLYEN
ncbi:chaperone modulator CbpM [Flavobacterium algicola]|uniref:chaperone modulator CbpM n=1 Tax=Flavobacterium algicola TaxID=556529 RepID=UPI001EFDD0E0|nr:chaperone modulator CbpM [Flavobacterium algicola]MCG9793474.1 chaperone modulator CbpM [Flavobacterium algicola]